MKTLECSSKGDKRFSAFYAKVSAFGKYDSIENHYQLSKRFGDFTPTNWKDAKGKDATHIEINGEELELKYLSQWYKLLWAKYLDANPDLVEYASTFDRFNDIFRGKSINCQADVVEQYVKQGRESLLEDCRELLEFLSGKKVYYKVVVAGSRGFNSYPLLEESLIEFLYGRMPADVEIVSGGARGADQLGEAFANNHGCSIKRFIPDWDGLGKSAGYVRNAEMAKHGDACIVFWDGISKGTKHMIDLAEREGLELKIVKY